MAVGRHGILANAIRYVRNGRRVGNRGCGRGRMDPWTGRAQHDRGFCIVTLAVDRQDGALKAWVASDHHSTPRGPRRPSAQLRVVAGPAA